MCSSDLYRWYYAPDVSVGVIPTNDGLTCVFASVATERFADWFGEGVGRGYREVLRRAAGEVGADDSERLLARLFALDLPGKGCDPKESDT